MPIERRVAPLFAVSPSAKLVVVAVNQWSESGASNAFDGASDGAAAETSTPNRETREVPIFSLAPSTREHKPRDRQQDPKHACFSLYLHQLGERKLSYRSCRMVFFLAAFCATLIPIKDYFLGSYVTKRFDEVRDDAVARQLGRLQPVMSSVHYYDTFSRDNLPLIDTQTRSRIARNRSSNKTLVEFLVHTSVSRESLLAALPETLRTAKISIMDEFLAPICGPTWETDAQLLFGNHFPVIRHDFCRDFGDSFPRDRFYSNNVPVHSSVQASSVDVSLGMIVMVNMSEVYLRHFDSTDVIRKIVRSIHEGFVGIPTAATYTDAAADAILARYSGGITISELLALLPESFTDHIRLIDLVGIKTILEYFCTPQQLTMGINVNSEPAVVAEITHATSSLLTLDFMATTIGMAPVSSTYMAPFWNCGIEFSLMAKGLALDQVDAVKLTACGQEKANILPAYIVNLIYLIQKSHRDYKRMDNTSVYTVGKNRAIAFEVPEKLSASPFLEMDGTAWTKVNNFSSVLSASGTLPLPTAYGYVYTPDCANLVDEAMKQSGRNVQKYQSFIGDGMGDCQFHDSQETGQQTLCRLIFGVDEVLLRDLDGNTHSISDCKELAPLSAFDQQSNFRQIEWFLLDTTVLSKRTRIQDNTSRQIRTFLLMLNLLGAVCYVLEYLTVLKSMWVFTRNSLGAVENAERSGSQPSDAI